MRLFNDNKAVHDVLQFDQAQLQHIQLIVKEKHVVNFAFGGARFQDERLSVQIVRKLEGSDRMAVYVSIQLYIREVGRAEKEVPIVLEPPARPERR